MGLKNQDMIFHTLTYATGTKIKNSACGVKEILKNNFEAIAIFSIRGVIYKCI